jgi:hypothetical protein
MRVALKRVPRMGRLIEVAPDQYFLGETGADGRRCRPLAP